LRTGKLMEFDEVRSGGSYLSSSDARLHFGLGTSPTMSEVRIEWPSGKTDVLQDLPADFIYTVVEGAGIRDKIAFPASTR